MLSFFFCFYQCEYKRQRKKKKMDFNAARAHFLRECFLDDYTLATIREQQQNSGFFCIHLRTTGADNVLVQSEKPILKHLFLQNPRFKSEIIEHYRQRGFQWVDVVCLNRTAWKIFLWVSSNEPVIQSMMSKPFLFNFASQEEGHQNNQQVADMV